MSFYIRKIKFESNAELLRSKTDISSLYADVISEFNFSNNGDLSVWKIDDLADISTLEKIMVAITCSTPICEDTTFIILSDSLLQKYGFSTITQGASGLNYCAELEQMHYNIKSMQFKDVSTCLLMYRDLLQNDDENNPKNIYYIEGSCLAEIILKARVSKLIDNNDYIKCYKCIKKNYTALLEKYKPSFKNI